ncbi:hypothetical protein BDQ12DRAFT_676582 [Crucibulum laeve]|uniref:Uncharacterized protein n=1 Tax=Crucibulum laeve TaxID=68775 RepID=A0A5C3ME19_9AGAR|nr:hypothetical protein BDQ12DRAFT_676582 [Crucibulum laeve]
MRSFFQRKPEIQPGTSNSTLQDPSKLSKLDSERSRHRPVAEHSEPTPLPSSTRRHGERRSSSRAPPLREPSSTVPNAAPSGSYNTGSYNDRAYASSSRRPTPSGYASAPPQAYYDPSTSRMPSSRAEETRTRTLRRAEPAPTPRPHNERAPIIDQTADASRTGYSRNDHVPFIDSTPRPEIWLPPGTARSARHIEKADTAQYRERPEEIPDRYRDRDRQRTMERAREGDRERERHREREKEREKEREEREKEKDAERERKDREREREKRRERDRREREREREAEREREREKEKEKERARERDKERERQYREAERYRERERQRIKEKGKDRQRSRIKERGGEPGTTTDKAEVRVTDRDNVYDKYTNGSAIERPRQREEEQERQSEKLQDTTHTRATQPRDRNVAIMYNPYLDRDRRKEPGRGDTLQQEPIMVRKSSRNFLVDAVGEAGDSSDSARRRLPTPKTMHKRSHMGEQLSTTMGLVQKPEPPTTVASSVAPPAPTVSTQLPLLQPQTEYRVPSAAPTPRNPYASLPPRESKPSRSMLHPDRATQGALHAQGGLSGSDTEGGKRREQRQRQKLQDRQPEVSGQILENPSKASRGLPDIANSENRSNQLYQLLQSSQPLNNGNSQRTGLVTLNGVHQQVPPSNPPNTHLSSNNHSYAGPNKDVPRSQNRSTTDVARGSDSEAIPSFPSVRGARESPRTKANGPSQQADLPVNTFVPDNTSRTQLQSTPPQPQNVSNPVVLQPPAKRTESVPPPVQQQYRQYSSTSAAVLESSRAQIYASRVMGTLDYDQPIDRTESGPSVYNPPPAVNFTDAIREHKYNDTPKPDDFAQTQAATRTVPTLSHTKQMENLSTRQETHYATRQPSLQAYVPVESSADTRPIKMDGATLAVQPSNSRESPSNLRDKPFDVALSSQRQAEIHDRNSSFPPPTTVNPHGLRESTKVMIPSQGEPASHNRNTEVHAQEFMNPPVTQDQTRYAKNSRKQEESNRNPTFLGGRTAQDHLKTLGSSSPKVSHLIAEYEGRTQSSNPIGSVEISKPPTSDRVGEEVMARAAHRPDVGQLSTAMSEAVSAEPSKLGAIHTEREKPSSRALRYENPQPTDTSHTLPVVAQPSYSDSRMAHKPKYEGVSSASAYAAAQRTLNLQGPPNISPYGPNYGQTVPSQITTSSKPTHSLLPNNNRPFDIAKPQDTHNSRLSVIPQPASGLNSSSASGYHQTTIRTSPNQKYASMEHNQRDNTLPVEKSTHSSLPKVVPPAVYPISVDNKLEPSQAASVSYSKGAYKDRDAPTTTTAPLAKSKIIEAVQGGIQQDTATSWGFQKATAKPHAEDKTLGKPQPEIASSVYMTQQRSLGPSTDRYIEPISRANSAVDDSQSKTAPQSVRNVVNHPKLAEVLSSSFSAKPIPGMLINPTTSRSNETASRSTMQSRPSESSAPFADPGVAPRQRESPSYLQQTLGLQDTATTNNRNSPSRKRPFDSPLKETPRASPVLGTAQTPSPSSQPSKPTINSSNSHDPTVHTRSRSNDANDPLTQSRSVPISVYPALASYPSNSHTAYPAISQIAPHNANAAEGRNGQLITHSKPIVPTDSRAERSAEMQASVTSAVNHADTIPHSSQKPHGSEPPRSRQISSTPIPQLDSSTSRHASHSIIPNHHSSRQPSVSLQSASVPSSLSQGASLSHSRTALESSRPAITPSTVPIAAPTYSSVSNMPSSTSGPPPSSRGPDKVHRKVSQESILKTPSSLAPSMLKATPSQVSIVPPVSDSETRKKGGILNIFRSSKATQEPPQQHQIWLPPTKTNEDDLRSKPPEAWVPPSSLRQRERKDSRTKMDSATEAMQTVNMNGAAAPSITRAKDPPAPINISASKKVFSPFSYLASKRNRTMSAASVEAQDGTAANTVVGSPTASMHSQAPMPLPPPLRDPLAATYEWRDDAEARAHLRDKVRRHRPGVVFDVGHDPGEDRVTTTRRKTRPSRRSGDASQSKGEASQRIVEINPGIEIQRVESRSSQKTVEIEENNDARRVDSRAS